LYIPVGYFAYLVLGEKKIYIYKRILSKNSKRNRGTFLRRIMDIHRYCHMQRVVKGRG
jgi:hypothetical protein